MRRLVRSISWVSVASALAVASACGGSDTPSAAVGSRGAGRGQQGPVPITITTVAEKAVPVQIAAVGTAEAYSTVQVHAQITGQLESVNFKEGDDVRAGQVLFTLDKRPLQAALEQAQANLARDVAQAANARTQAQRYQDLLSRGIATKEQVEQNTTAAAALDATVAADRAAVDNAQIQLQYATITSPISGRTGALQVHAGNLVRAADTTPLVTINQVTPIDVDFGIPESMLDDFKHYMAAGTLRIEANAPTAATAPAAGRISFVDNQVDQTTGQIKVKGTFPNADRRLWPGEFLNVVVTLTVQANALVVPSVAVQTGQQGQYVFVIKPDQTADLRSVSVERTVGSESVIKSGLKPGETIATDGQLNLVTGSRITVKNDGPKATS